MRDNIIIGMIVIIFYYIFSRKINYKSIILILLISLLLLEFRSYLILVIIATLLFTFKNSKSLFKFNDLIYFMAIIGTIYFFVNFNFQLNHSNTFFSFSK